MRIARLAACVRILLLVATAVAGCGREPRSLVMLDVVADREWAGVTIVFEARGYGVYRSLSEATVHTADAGGALQVGLYLPSTARGEVNIDATASVDVAGQTCIVGTGHAVVSNVQGGAASAPTLLEIVSVPPSCTLFAPSDAGPD